MEGRCWPEDSGGWGKRRRDECRSVEAGKGILTSRDSMEEAANAIPFPRANKPGSDNRKQGCHHGHSAGGDEWPIGESGLK